MSKLYVIQAELLDLIARLDQEEDPVEYEKLMQEIERLEIDKHEKLDGCCEYITSLKDEIRTINNRTVELRELREKAERKIENFTKYLIYCLPDKEKWKSATHSISWRESTQAVAVDPEIIPLQYIRQKITLEPDKEQAKQDMKMGAVIPGFELVKKNNIQIK